MDRDDADIPDPSTWRTADDPPTKRQQAYLETLAEDAGEPVPDDLTKAEASERIDALRQREDLDSGADTADATESVDADEPAERGGWIRDPNSVG